MRKGSTFLLITILSVSSMVMVGCAFAQSIPKPSVPDFTVKFVDFYDVPPTYEVNPNTGETTITQEGFRSDMYHIVVTIKNQPFTPYTNDDGNIIRMSYRIDYKFDVDQYWSYLGGPFASDSEYTVSTYICGRQAGEPKLRKLHPGDKLNFKVQAAVGTSELSLFDNNYVSEKSGWSEIQTLTIPDTTPSVTLLSPQNETFSTSDVPLNFSVDKYAFQLEYSLDGGENATVAGNATLTGLIYGYHNVTVYAIDKLGNIGASETTFFTIAEPFPTTLVVASVITVSVAVIVLLVYFKKRKH
jgi:hypothetical protein